MTRPSEPGHAWARSMSREARSVVRTHDGAEGEN